MHDRQGNNLRLTHTEHHRGGHFMKRDAWHSWIGMRSETVWNTLVDVLQRVGVAINGNVAETAIGTQVIHSSHMIVVLMGEKHRTKPLKGERKHLLPEVRTTIDENVLSAIGGDKGGSAQPFVAWIVRTAYFTWATDLRDSRAGARAEKS